MKLSARQKAALGLAIRRKVAESQLLAEDLAKSSGVAVRTTQNAMLSISDESLAFICDALEIDLEEVANSAAGAVSGSGDVAQLIGFYQTFRPSFEDPSVVVVSHARIHAVEGLDELEYLESGGAAKYELRGTVYQSKSLIYFHTQFMGSHRLAMVCQPFLHRAGGEAATLLVGSVTSRTQVRQDWRPCLSAFGLRRLETDARSLADLPLQRDVAPGDPEHDALAKLVAIARESVVIA